jgi:hypothetical protein
MSHGEFTRLHAQVSPKDRSIVELHKLTAGFLGTTNISIKLNIRKFVSHMSRDADAWGKEDCKLEELEAKSRCGIRKPNRP